MGVDELTEQRAALLERRAAFEQAASEAQSAIERAGASVEDVIIARARHSAALAARDDVDAQIARLDQESAAAQAERERQAAIERIIAHAAAGREAFAEYEAARQTANEAMLVLFERILAPLRAVRAARSGFIEEARQLAPGLTKRYYTALVHEDVVRREQAQVAELFAELEWRGADLSVVRAVWRRGEETVEDSTTLLAAPVEPFGHVIEAGMMAYEQIDAQAQEIARRNDELLLSAKAPAALAQHSRGRLAS